MNGRFTCFSAAVLLALGISSGCEPQPAGSVPSLASGGEVGPLKVVTVLPARKTITRRTEQPGQVEPFEVAPLYARVPGYVRKLHVDIGDTVTGPKYDNQGKVVEPGQSLVELDVPELHDELRQRQAAVALAQAEQQQAQAAAKVAAAKLAFSQALIEEANAGVSGAKANVVKWKAENDRISKLVESGTITQKLVDESTSQLRSAEADQAAMQAKVASAQAGVSQAQADIEKAAADVRAAEAQVAVREAELQHSATTLQYSTLRAPFDGVVINRNVHTGYLVSEGTSSELPILVVARTDRLRLAVDVPESDAVHVQIGTEVKLRIPSLPAESLTSKVARTQWSLQEGSRTLHCEVDLDNKDGKLRSGMYLYADVKVAEHKDALTIPRSAVMIQETQAVCYSVDEKRQIIKIPITVGLRVGTDVEVLSGLSENTAVIAANISSLREGQEVEVAK